MNLWRPPQTSSVRRHCKVWLRAKCVTYAEQSPSAPPKLKWAPVSPEEAREEQPTVPMPMKKLSRYSSTGPDGSGRPSGWVWCQCRALHRTTATGNNSQLSDSTMGGSLAYSTAIRTVNWSHKCNKQMVVVVVGAALHGKQDEGEQQAKDEHTMGFSWDLVPLSTLSKYPPCHTVVSTPGAMPLIHCTSSEVSCRGVSQRSTQRGTTV